MFQNKKTSLEIIRAGQTILNKVAPNLPVPVKNLGNYLLNPQKQPQMSYMWELEFYDAFGSIEGQHLTYYAKTIGIPTTNLDVIKRSYAGVEYAYSGKDVSPRIFRTTFWDNQDLMAYRYFTHWKDCMAKGEDMRKATPENYMRSVQIRLKDTSDLLITQRINLYGVFPTEISEIALNYNESSEVTFDVMFYFHHRELA